MAKSPAGNQIHRNSDRSTVSPLSVKNAVAPMGDTAMKN
jgi:hypothetical protein